METNKFLMLLFCFSLSAIHSMQKTKIKAEKLKSLKYQPFGKTRFNKNLFSKKSYTPIRPKSDLPTKEEIIIPQQTWRNKFTNFLTFKKFQQSTDTKTIQNTSFAQIKVKTEQEDQQKNPQSYWRKFLGVIGAALAGGTVATKQDNNDPLSEPEFEDLRKFIKSKEDSTFNKQITSCISDKDCLENLRGYSYGVIEKWFPHIFFKGENFDRVINATLAEDIIKKNNLNRLAIPKKTIFYDGLDWRVASQRIQGDKNHTLTLEEIKQVAIFVQETGYGDWLGDNLIFDRKSGKLFFIDTEDNSFNSDNKLSSLAKLARNVPMTDEAYKWLSEFFENTKNKPKKDNINPALPRNPKYNNDYINKVRDQATSLKYKQFAAYWKKQGN